MVLPLFYCLRQSHGWRLGGGALLAGGASLALELSWGRLELSGAVLGTMIASPRNGATLRLRAKRTLSINGLLGPTVHGDGSYSPPSSPFVHGVLRPPPLPLLPHQSYIQR